MATDKSIPEQPRSDRYIALLFYLKHNASVLERSAARMREDGQNEVADMLLMLAESMKAGRAVAEDRFYRQEPVEREELSK